MTCEQIKYETHFLLQMSRLTLQSTSPPKKKKNMKPLKTSQSAIFHLLVKTAISMINTEHSLTNIALVYPM